MKVFVSSVIGGFEEFREAALSGIRTLGNEGLRAEDFSASTQTAQQACLGAVRASDVVVLVLGDRYGAIQESGLSATHEEYREARGTKPVLVFVQQRIDPDEQQRRFIDEVQEWASGHTTRPFRTPPELTEAIIKGLHDHELATTAGEVDTQEMLGRARDLLNRYAQLPPSSLGSRSPSIELVVVGGPLQQVLRPAEIESAQLARDLQQAGLFGESPVLDSSLGTTVDVSGDTLLVSQGLPRVAVTQTGSVIVRQPVSNSSGTPTFGLPAIIEEDVADRIASAIAFTAEVLDRIDPTHRLTRVVVQCGLANAGYTAWRTRAEHQASPQSVTINRGPNNSVVGLSPPSVSRQALRHEAEALTEDLVALLRREANR